MVRIFLAKKVFLIEVGILFFRHNSIAHNILKDGIITSICTGKQKTCVIHFITMISK